jgi:hypothetical protein
MVAAKQDEVTRLNQEGVRLVSELAHTKQSLYEQLTQGRKLEQKLEQLQSLQLHASDIERQLASKTAEVELMAEAVEGGRQSYGAGDGENPGSGIAIGGGECPSPLTRTNRRSASRIPRQTCIRTEHLSIQEGKRLSLDCY